MAHWTQTLAEVERSIEGCLESLERYEMAFTRALGERGIQTAQPATAWDSKVDESTRTVDEVEQLLAEQDGVWNRWRETLASLQGSIKQPA